MTNLYLILWIGTEAIALCAADVEAVVDLNRVAPIPFAPRHVVGLAAVRSQTVTVIDASLATGGPALDCVGRAVVTSVAGHRYAVRVTGIEDVAALGSPVAIDAGRLGDGWSACAIGRLDYGDGYLLLVDPAALIGLSELAVAA